jgi:hypothetical protein
MREAHFDLQQQVWRLFCLCPRLASDWIPSSSQPHPSTSTLYCGVLDYNHPQAVHSQPQFTLKYVDLYDGISDLRMSRHARCQ